MLRTLPSIREPDHSHPHRGPLCQLRQLHKPKRSDYRFGASSGFIVAVPVLVVFALNPLRTTHFSRTYHPEARTCFENEDRRDPEPLEVAQIRVDVSGFSLPWSRPSDQLETLSEEAENCGWRKNSAGHNEGVRRLVPSPQVRPRRSDRPHQTLRGIGRISYYCTRLTRMAAGIRRCQFED